MTQSSLEAEIMEAFCDAAYPGDANIAYHQCEECARIRSDFRGQTAASLHFTVIEYHHDSLPLLAPAAYHFFLPAYLCHVLKHFDSDVTQFLLFNLRAPRTEYLRQFSARQKQTIVDFLQFLKAIDIDNDFVEEIESSLRTWRAGSH